MNKSLLLVIAVCMLLCLPWNTVRVQALEWDPNQRPVSLVKQTEQAIVLDNVRWGSDFDGVEFRTRFQRVTIRPDLLKDVYYCDEAFPPKMLAAHVMLAFIFKTPEGVVAADGSRDIGLVISVTQRLPQGDSGRSLMKSFFPGRTDSPWPLLYEIGSYSDRIQTSVIKLNRQTRHFRLKLPEAVKRRVLQTGIRLALENHSNDYYQVLQNNCVTGAIDILFRELKEQLGVFWVVPGKLVNLKLSLPRLTPSHLRNLKLIDREVFIVDRNTPLVTFPSADGREFRIVPKSMPGFGVAAPLIAFAEHLQKYIELGRASVDLRQLLDNLTISHRDFPKFLKLREEVIHDLAAVEDSMFREMKSDPLLRISYYMKSVRRQVNVRHPEIRHLEEKFNELLRSHTLNATGRNPAKARELIDQLQVR